MFDALAGVDLILHAGDVGELDVLDRLSSIAPVVAVSGNDEPDEARRVLPTQALVHVRGTRILLTHSHRLDPAEEALARQADDWPTILEYRRDLAAAAGADVVVFGHLHTAMAVRRDRVLLVNPGVIGHGHVVVRSTLRSVARLSLTDGGPAVVHVDVDTGKPFDPTLDDAGYWATMDRLNASIVDVSVDADWRTFWRALRDVSHGPTWTALLTLATRVWTGRDEVITPAALLEELARDERVPPEMLADYRRVLRELTRPAQ